ncbi:hypothetical protein AGLY_005901 [Aphis glycines]|uniref:Uncharacterized protein n=1 Tax=Aphis glycines TaxID=307491 RepID=A0A6G0TTH7_APHGL|nr:hypothetical protein AGLY_005901 [Aphis glycines]
MLLMNKLLLNQQHNRLQDEIGFLYFLIQSLKIIKYDEKTRQNIHTYFLFVYVFNFDPSKADESSSRIVYKSITSNSFFNPFRTIKLVTKESRKIGCMFVLTIELEVLSKPHRQFCRRICATFSRRLSSPSLSDPFYNHFAIFTCITNFGSNNPILSMMRQMLMSTFHFYCLSKILKEKLITTIVCNPNVVYYVNYSLNGGNNLVITHLLLLKHSKEHDLGIH